MRLRLFAIGFVCFILNINSWAEKPKILALADPWCPYTCDIKALNRGYLVEIAEAALPDFEIDYQDRSWSVAIEEARYGGAAMILGALKSDAPDFRFPQKSVASQTSCVFQPAVSIWKYENLNSLDSLTLAVVENYSYGKPLDDYILNAKKQSGAKLVYVSGTNTTVKLAAKLAAKSISGFLEDRNVYENFMQSTRGKDFSEKFEMAKCFDSSPLYIAFSPSKKIKSTIDPLQKAFDEGLQRLEKTGKLAALKRKYFIKD